MIEKQETMERPWDILIILDGCCYDYFERCNTMDGRLIKVVSPATGTEAWFKEINSYDCSNIVYMTPIVKFDSWYPEHDFFKIIRLWDKNMTYEYNGVDPIWIAKLAIKCIKEHPNQKIIVHFCTPHPPFLTMDTKHQEMIKKESVQTNKTVKESKIKRKSMYVLWMLKQRLPTVFFWHIERLLGVHGGMLVLYQAAGFKLIRKLYYDNLMLVLSAIERIKDSTDKKIVVTADHGQRLGEYGMFGHGGWRSKSVIVVPWFEMGEKI